MIKLKKGLDLPILGAPVQKIYQSPKVKHVALLGNDYIGMKPTMLVKVGDSVKKGQAVFSDKKTEGVVYTSPVSGKVVGINRGAKRVFLSLVIEVSGEEEVTFKAHKAEELADLAKETVVQQLLESGMWPAIRMRPFSKVANPEDQPNSLFINTMDTNPLSPDPSLVLQDDSEAFADGVQVLSKLASKTYVCKSPDTKLPELNEGVVVEEFSGPHPAGNVGTHIHFLDPVFGEKIVWHLNYQDVIAIGKLFTTGKLDFERVISLAGPSVVEPRLIKVTQGASTEELTKGQISDRENRVVSGSVLSGRTAVEHEAFLGRYALQVSVLEEGREREFLGWHAPGFDKFSIVNLFASKMFPEKRFALTTSTNGSLRSMVPIGSYEKVMPLELLPTSLLRTLLGGNTERSQSLGCMELDEEDVALCTFVCPCKIDFGPVLRNVLTKIEKEG